MVSDARNATLAAVYGLISAVALLVMLAILWRDFGERTQRAVLLFGFGSLAAMIPQAAGFLGARSLTLPSVGACGVLACILVSAFGLTRSASLAVTPRRFGRACLTLLVLVHVVAAPVGWFVSDFFYVRMARMTRAGERRARLAR